MTVLERRFLKFVSILMIPVLVYTALNLRFEPEWERQDAPLDQTVLVMSIDTDRRAYIARFTEANAACMENILKYSTLATITLGQKIVYVDHIKKYKVINFRGRSHFKCGGPIWGELLDEQRR
jgi:hypothetical protein